MHPPESIVKSKKSKKDKDDKDKKKKKKRDKSENKGDRKLKVKELGDVDVDEDVDGIIQQKYGGDMASEAGSVAASQQNKFRANLKGSNNKTIDPAMNRTAMAGGFAGGKEGNLMNESMNASEYNNRPQNKGNKNAMTLEVGEDQLSNGNYSAGGTRFVANLRNPNAFYGGNPDDSIS